MTTRNNVRFRPLPKRLRQAFSRAGMKSRSLDNQELTDGVYRLTFRDEYIASHAKPAQFVGSLFNDQAG